MKETQLNVDWKWYAAVALILIGGAWNFLQRNFATQRPAHGADVRLTASAQR